MSAKKIRELQKIANILRRDILKMTSAAKSGHPTSCLSAAEIMSSLFFNEMSYDIKNPFNPDNDEFILSKGHAAPVLYSALFRAGCINYNLLSLRKINSPLEGHPVPHSLKWVKAATGSLGQGLSIGAGMALAGKLQKRNFRVYVLLGDSEISEGSVYEAMQLAFHYKLNNLIAIVDVNRLGQTGETMLAHNLTAYKKRFEGFGWKAIIINGHDIKEILNAFLLARKSSVPSIILAKTLKGKGVSFLEDKEGWHGKALDNEQLKKALSEIPDEKMPKVKIKKPSSPKTFSSKIKLRKNIKTKIDFRLEFAKEKATREAYGDALAFLASTNDKVIAIDAEVSNSTFSEKVKKQNPENFVEAYIAEQNMAGMAFGLSVKGFNVFASSFAAFLSRAHDQIRMISISSPKKITFCGSHAGASIGKDGASQMGLEDIAMFRSLPNSIIFYPSDAVSSFKLTLLASKLNGIKYIRTTRPKTPVIYSEKEKFNMGDFKILKQSKKDKAVLIGVGITLHESLKACEELKRKKINVAVIDLYCIKPLNFKKLETFIKKHGKKAVIAEDHYPEGGIGEMLGSYFANSETKIKHLAIKEIPHSGTKEELLKKYKIDWKAIIKETENLLKNK